jgi:hypothetical protein
MRHLYLYSTLITLFFCNVINAQTGPGGVGNSTTNPYWIDVHTNGGANGSNVSVLNDYSGNGNNAVQANASEQPVYGAGIVNGRDAVQFNGDDCLISGGTSALNSPGYLNYYVVSQINDYATLSIPFNLDYGSPNYLDAFSGLLIQSGNVKVYGRNQSNALKTALIGNPAGSNVLEGVFDFSGQTLTSKLNFSTISTYSPANKPSPSTHEGVWLGGKSGVYNMTGYISEVFVFNYQLNTAEDKIVKNYLSAKFGVATANDMYAYESTHGLGVVGIGQDDASNNHLSSQGNGVVSISKGSLNDGDYLFVGHDDVPITTLAYDVPASMINAARFQRVWRADETVDIGTITLTFDLDPSTDYSADPNNYRLLIDHTDDDFSVVDLSVAGTYNAGANSITFTNIDLTSGDYFTLAGDAPQDIISITTGLWSQPTTWNCSCVPGSFDKVTVDNGHTVTLDINSSITKLTVNPTGTLTWNSNENIDLVDSLKIYGTINMGTDGKFTLNGTGTQVIDLAGNLVDFTNLELNNSGSGVTLANGTLQLNGTLSPTLGDFNFSSGTFIVNSTSATTTGRIGPITTGVNLIGTATVRRYLPAGLSGARNISSPVIGADLSMWDATISISGIGFPDGCAWGPDGCYFSVKQYDGANNQYVDITNPNEPLANGEGYEVYIGDDLNTFSGATLNSTGTIRSSSDFVASVGQGWSIQGNPYASPVLFSTLNKNFIGSTYFYVYDAASASYQWYDQASNSSSIPELANGMLAIGQGFWTNSGSSSNGTITYTQADKTSSTATFIRRLENNNQSFDLTLTQEGTTYKNTASIGFHDVSVDSYDSLDVKYFTSERQKASSILIQVENEKLAKSYLAKDDRNKKVNVSVKILEEGYFAIDASNIENQTLYQYITLIDKQTNQKIDLRKTSHYSFYAEEGEFDRFTIILSNDRVVGNELSPIYSDIATDDITISQIGNTINIQSNEVVDGNADLTIYNLLGQELIFSTTFEIQKGDNLVIVPENLSGIYIVVIKSTNGITTKKMMF